MSEKGVWRGDTRGGIMVVFHSLFLEATMKIAFATNDGERISQHFGRARFFLVVTIEEGNVVSKELRGKVSHRGMHAGADLREGDHEGESHRHHREGHGMHRHGDMLTTISDCEILVAGGMGTGAYSAIIESGLTPILTDIKTIDKALAAYLSGTLESRTERIH